MLGLLVALGVGVFCLVLYRLLKVRRLRSQLRWMKHAPGLPLLGSLLEFKNKEVILPVFMKYAKKYDGLYNVNIGDRTFIVASDPKFLESILTSQKVLYKGEEYKFLAKWLETGLLTAGAKKWPKFRKIITPSFHFSILEKFVEVFESASDVLIQKLEEEVDKGSVDIFPYIKLCALDTICESSMGVSIDAQNNKNEDYVFAVDEMCRITIDRAFSAMKFFDLTYTFTKDYWKEKEYVNVLHFYTERILKKKKKELLEKDDKKVSDQDDIGAKKKIAFLDLLLQKQMDGEQLTDDEIRQEVDTFMFAGHDTVTSAISFTLYLLSIHPDIQEEAFQEQKRIVGSSNGVQFQELKEIKYLEKVIKEALRLYPSVPFYSRHVKEDIFYEGHVIPSGTTIIIFAYGAGRNPEIFPEPDKFNPSRYDGEYILPFSYIPFSAGPRNCIGQKYAMLEMKCIIGKILRNFELLPASPKHEIELSAQTVLKSKNGICVNIKKRNA